MDRMTAFLALSMLLCMAGVCRADGEGKDGGEHDDHAEHAEDAGGVEVPEGILPHAVFPHRILGTWFDRAKVLEDAGITVDLGVTQIWQQNVRGGMSTKNSKSRYSGSYDLEITLDLETIAGWKGASVYGHGEGSWSDGIGDVAVGSVFGVNGDAGGGRSIDLTELYIEQSLFDDKLVIRIGKLNLGGGFECRGCPVSFDGNQFANDETSQFMNDALVNNPTIPFPDVGLGVMVYWNPIEWWYAGAGVADAQADGRETGFNTTFNGVGHAFGIFETGVVPQMPSSKGPLQGAYRVGFWYNGEPMDRLDGEGTKRSHMGVYISADQALCKENAEGDDSQGLGVFCRVGVADADVSDVKSFWSVGGQYQGLVPSRDDDVLGFGVAQGRFSASGQGYGASHETVMELYYNAQVMPWLSVSPHVQYIMNPAGDSAIKDAVVVGVRVQIAL